MLATPRGISQGCLSLGTGTCVCRRMQSCKVASQHEASKLRFSLFSEPGDSTVASSDAVSGASEELTEVYPLPGSGESSFISAHSCRAHLDP